MGWKCHADHCTVSRFLSPEWISGIHCSEMRETENKGSILALKLHLDIISPKQRNQWSHKKKQKKNLCLPNLKKNPKGFLVCSIHVFSLDLSTGSILSCKWCLDQRQLFHTLDFWTQYFETLFFFILHYFKHLSNWKITYFFCDLWLLTTLQKMMKRTTFLNLWIFLTKYQGNCLFRRCSWVGGWG